MSKFEFKPKLFLDLREYNKEKLTADIMAGLIVGIVALPLAIAFGIASGVTPEKGIITAIIAGLAVSLFGGSRVQIGGPTGAFIVIIYGIIQQYGEAGLLVATVMAGVFLILLGVFHLGTIIKYIPYPIVVGFTSGIAVTIFTTQIKDLFGLTIDNVPADFIEKWIVYIRHFGSLDVWSTAVGIVSVAIIALSPKLTHKIPGSLIAIIVMTVGVYLLKQYGIATQVETIGDRFMIKAELPGMNVPELNWESIKQLMAPAITIAILGAIESLLSATVADGAIARTMTNINNGGRTPVAGIVHAVVLLLIFLLLMPLAQYIPMACLAGVLVIVSYNMSGWRTFRELLRNPKSDVAVLLITFFLTVIFDLTVAIEFGLVLACLLFIKRVMETTEVNLFKDEIVPTDADGTVISEEHLHIPDHTEVYEINGPYFFGIANRFEEVVLQTKEQPKVRIIRMRKVPFIDSTGIHNLTNLCEMSHREGVHIILSGVNPKVHEALKKSGFYELLGKKNICDNIHTALEVARHYLNR